MTHIDKLKKELGARGYDLSLEPVEVTKNKVTCTGIRIIDAIHPNVSPIVYYSAAETAETILERILDAVGREAPAFAAGKICDKDYLASHLYLAVSRRGGEMEDVVAGEYLNLDLIMKVVVSGEIGDLELGITKLTYSLLEAAGMTEDEAWAHAFANTGKTVQVCSIAEALGIPEDVPGNMQMYVASTNHGSDGASVIAFPEVLEELCLENGFDALYVIPSSTQEMLVVPYSDTVSVEDLVQMVYEVNAGMVDPLIQLDPAVYQFTLESRSIVVASAQKGGLGHECL